ncbi:poly-gamma-glutamate biosynthesis protein PgsC/CapC [Qipengyuania atrilutea]|uniref:Capsule biosynthesis CapC n=1 Tax=Qipengyuania atrilutea TaxID=2744473 RepID=A0A850HBK0_9SPHN|nr:poly-gamma-glutamate biosynthesis protein PgsC/CapC [Actirhodobacter atriluteus]NVD44449.1 hypothetical protein [Actirhodobacter atriluteus]
MNLTIFPEGGLAGSVITTVWVGVWVLCFFNLRFGWVLSGLVVPGYLVPLLIIKPLAGAIIIVEAILTYMMVWLFSERIGRGRWPSLFGRDRFMGLILASIAVRLSLDGYVLPQLAEWLSANWNQQLDWRSDMQSFGLVIISLLANQFWKPGLSRGLFAMVVTVGLTALIVRFGLMELTNFRLSGVSYLYEGLASSILASPKAYMILVLTALYASHMNVKYGWDFSGILIPALIALQWYQPAKILTSFVEAGIIYLIAIAVLRLPVFANITMEGARKILLFFNISFIYKLILGHAVVLAEMEVKTTDLYGFGYLLATLIAIKAHDKNIFGRLMRTTLQVSFVGAVAGNLVGLILSSLVPVQSAVASVSDAPVSGSDAQQRRMAAAAIGDAYLQRWRGGAEPISAESAETLIDLVRLLEAGLPPLEANARVGASGWRVETLAGGRIAISRADGDGRAMLFYYPDAARDLAITVPDASAQPGLAMAALSLRTGQDAKWVVLDAPRARNALGRPSTLSAFRQGSQMPELVVAGGRGATGNFAGGSASRIDIAALRNAVPGMQTRFTAGQSAAGADTNDAVLTLGDKAIASFWNDASSQTAGSCDITANIATASAITDLPDLAFLRAEIVDPLLAALEDSDVPSSAIAAGQSIGIDVGPCATNGGRAWRIDASGRGGGIYLFYPGGDAGRIVQGYLESDARAGPFDLVQSIRNAWGASALLLAPDQHAFGGDQTTIFGVISQAVVRARGDRDAAVLQIRPMPMEIAEEARVTRPVLSFDRIESGSALRGNLERALRAAEIDPLIAARDRETAGLEVSPLNSLRYMRQTVNQRYAVLLVPDKLTR